MSHTPADVLAEALAQAGTVVRPDAVPAGQTPTWPVYVGHLPDSPDNAVAVYDTSGTPDGRIMKTGETIRHPGFQVRTRARTHQEAYQKLLQIAEAIDAIRRLVVALDGTGYTIAAATRTGDLLPLGQEPDSKKRDGFTLNGTITYQQQEQ